ncbi:ABC transporter permease [Nocardiopsis sp. EMB25]|uniref:ABC transporter permease n=1 Tax=Nocardiopsis sp. EMB25 TaxID=2835867 RepID=UPI00228410CB|nr:ABC transporter permease [Nocardiopsis sp. EMB25]MCY9786875.1 ABC transporter permease [Nocardiopsis sp. EMB25]
MTSTCSRTRTSVLFWPLPPVFVLVPAALILVLTLADTWSQLSWRALDWVYLSAEVGTRARLPVVVAAGAAALVGARFTRPGLVFAQRWQPRVERDVPWRHCAVVTGWCLTAYLVGLLPLSLAVAAYGAGVPDLTAIAGALTGFAALTLFGYLCGVTLRGPLAVPVAVGLVFLLASLPLVSDAWSSLSLQLPVSPSLGTRESTAVGPYRIGFFLLLAVALAWTVAALLRTPRRFSAGYGLAVAAVAVAVVLPHLRPFPLLAHAGDGTEVCSERAGVRYCVHEGHRDELTTIADLSVPIFDAHGLADAAPDEVRDLSLAESDGEVLSQDQQTLWLRVYPGWEPEQEVPSAAAEWLVPDVFRCGSGGVASLAADAPPEARRAAVLADLRTWLITRAHEDGPVDDGVFAGAAPERVREWIRRNPERLSTCDVDPGELPWRT